MQMAAIITLLLHEKILGVSMHLAGTVLLWIAAVLTLWSAYEYLRDTWDELVGSKVLKSEGATKDEM